MTLPSSCVHRLPLKTCRRCLLPASRRRTSTYAAPKQCWRLLKKLLASLWTAKGDCVPRPQRIARGSVAIAVVVKELVSADAAGGDVHRKPCHRKA